MTVRELYDLFEERIPADLCEEWDNDGLMCSADETKQLKRVLISLDVTEEVVEYAVNGGFDLIISHHPLIFRPLKSLSADNHIARKLIRLVSSDISVFSFHTRADKVRGGVNDCLARLIGLTDVQPLGDDCLGRIGRLDCEMMGLDEFSLKVKGALGADRVVVSDAYNPVCTVALVGGEGKSYVKDAVEAGADTFLSGSIGYNTMEEAAELGINLVEAGHYATEFPVTAFFAHLVRKFDPRIYVETVPSNMLRTV